MRMLITSSILAAVITFAYPSFSDETVSTTDGRQLILKSDGTFEVIAAAEATGSEYKVIDITDLKLDIGEMDGELIDVMVGLGSFGGMVTISDPRDPFDMNPIFAEAEDLPRDDREFILRRCGEHCRVRVRGVVENVMFQPGLRLHEIVR